MKIYIHLWFGNVAWWHWTEGCCLPQETQSIPDWLTVFPHCVFSCLHAWEIQNSTNHTIGWCIYAWKQHCDESECFCHRSTLGICWRMFAVSPPPSPSLCFCQMWGHGRSHINLSTRSSEDTSAVILHHPLRVWGSAQYSQWGQCGPHDPSRAPALSQVGTQHLSLQTNIDPPQH